MTCNHYCVSGHLITSHDSENTARCWALDDAELQGNLPCDECDWNGNGWARLLRGTVRVLVTKPDRYGLILLLLVFGCSLNPAERQRLSVVVSLN